MSGAYGFSAADSVTGAIFQWTLGTIDFSGTGYPGPNSPVNQRLVATSNQGPAGAPGAAGAAFIVALVATANVATLSGIQTIDGVATGTTPVLLTAQTSGAQDQIYVPSTSGAWTPAATQPTVGQTIFVTGGAVNKQQYFMMVLGVAGTNAAILPAKAPPVIFANEAPWLLKGDASDETVGLKAVFDYANLSGRGTKISFGPGVVGRYLTSQPIVKGRYVSVEGAGRISVEIGTVNLLQDTFILSEQLNIGGGDHAKFSHIKISNATGATQAPVRVSGAAYTAGQIVRCAIPGIQLLQCTTGGTTGAHPPIGELSPVNPFMKLTGQANADKQPVVVVRSGGYFGAMTFQLSVDNCATLDSTVHTTTLLNSDGTYCDFATATFPGSGTLGVQLPSRSALDAGIYDADTLAATFVQPAVGANVQISISGTGGNTTRLTNTGFVYINGGGLYSLVSVDTALLTTVKCVTQVATTGATVATSWVGQAYYPQPRVEVIGAPPADSWAVDLAQTSAQAKLGASTTFRYSTRAIAPADRGKSQSSQLEIPTITTAAGAFYDYTDPVSGCTFRFHTGIYTPNVSYNYTTPDSVSSMVVGSTITDGSVVWTVVQGPECIRSNGRGFLTLDDVWLEGGMTGIQICQSEGVTIHDTVFNGCLTAGGYGTNGDGRLGEYGGFTNNVTFSGSCFWYTNGYGIVYDGGNSFTVEGAVGFQSCPSGFMKLTNMAGGKASGFYVESSGPALIRDCAAFTRRPTSFGMNGFLFAGFFTGSVSGAYSFDMWASSGVSWLGGQFGGSSYGIHNAVKVTNGHTEGCQHINSHPLLDTTFSTGRSVDQGVETRVLLAIDFPNAQTLANGVNDLAAPVFSDVDLSGPSAAFSIRSGPANAVAGQRTTYRYFGTQQMTLTHGGGSWPLMLPGAADVVLQAPAGGYIEFTTVYRAGSINRHVVEKITAPQFTPIRIAPNTTDTITAADNGVNVQYTNAAGCAITLNTLPAGFSCLCSQEAAGALTFVNGASTVRTAIASSGATTAQYMSRFLFWKDATNTRIT